MCKALGGDTRLVEETETRHIAMREASLRANASKVTADQLRDMPPGFKFVCAEDRGEPAMDNKIDVDQESKKIATAGVDDMPTGFRFLSDEDRERVAKQVVEQSLKRKRQEIEEKEISLKRKRCYHVMSCYKWVTEFGFKLDSRTVFHILDTVAVLTKADAGIESEVV